MTKSPGHLERRELGVTLVAFTGAKETRALGSGQAVLLGADGLVDAVGSGIDGRAGSFGLHNPA